MIALGTQNISDIKLGSTQIQSVMLGDKEIWSNWKYLTTPISKNVSSSSGGWNEWYSWSSGWITLDKPIKNPTGYVYLSTRDTSASNARGYVKYSDGTTEMVGHVSGGYHGSNESWSGKTTFNLTNDKEIVAYKIDGEHKKFSGSSTVEIKFETYYQKG